MGRQQRRGAGGAGFGCWESLALLTWQALPAARGQLGTAEIGGKQAGGVAQVQNNPPSASTRARAEREPRRRLRPSWGLHLRTPQLFLISPRRCLRDAAKKKGWDVETWRKAQRACRAVL